MHFRYKTKGTCAGAIEIDINDETNIIENITFIGGCRGNTQGVSKLVAVHFIDEIIPLLSGIQCRGGTSCPDQLARALVYYKENLQH